MNKYKSTCKEIAIETLGSFLIAIGIYNFAVASEFPMTGFSGIAMILYRLFHLPIGFTTVLLNIPVAFLSDVGIILFGGYQQDKKDVVLTACDNQQMYYIQRHLKEVDPKAFTIILESNEVHGEGFHMFEVGDKKK